MTNILTIKAVAREIERVLDEADHLDKVLVAATPVAETSELELLATEITRRLDEAEASIAMLDAADGSPDDEDSDPGGGDVQDEPHDAVDEDAPEETGDRETA